MLAWFFGRSEIARFGFLGGPRGGLKTIAHLFGWVSSSPRAAQTTEMSDVRSAKKPCTKILSSPGDLKAVWRDFSMPRHCLRIGLQG